MWKIALFLIFTLIAVPVLTFMYDEPLSESQRNTMSILIWVYGIAAFLCFVVSQITKNYSQVDKLWSIMPVPYIWIIAFQTHFDPRISLMAILVTLWAIRLTFNFARRGGYSWKFWTGEEDYRWSILRAKPGFEQNWKWTLFNFVFISAYQMALILLITLPALKAMDSQFALTWVDFLLAAIIVTLIIIEFIADQQQYNYQQEKYRKIKAGEELTGKYALGFTHTGLWGFVRHPNYAAEQAIWIALYFFSVVATGHWINWSIAGCLLLVLLFVGSSDFSESISRKKYPAYERYMSLVGRFIPFKGRFKP